MDRKNCNKCGVSKPANLECFTRGRGLTLGSCCRACQYEATRIWRQSPKVKAEQAERRAKRTQTDEHRERERARNAVRREKGRQGKPRRERYTPEQARAAAKVIQATANRKRRSTPEGTINHRVSSSLRQCLRQAGIGKQARRWEELVGYTASDLRQHLERQFIGKMSWENAGEWHIDHIVPMATFTFESAADPAFKACWALANLRPLWASENARKHATRLHLI